MLYTYPMKILTIDDQQLILLSLEKRLVELGYDVRIAGSGRKGIEIFELFQPDLVIVDINMPDISGLEVVKHIRSSNHGTTPIMVMSGNTNEDIIMDGFDLGIDDYMKKPVSLNEVAARVKRILGTPQGKEPKVIPIRQNQLIQEYCVGVVIPCYNEADRLLSEEFTDFSFQNLGYQLCFVNDGSTDNTLDILEELKKGNENHITIYDCEKNGGPPVEGGMKESEGAAPGSGEGSSSSSIPNNSSNMSSMKMEPPSVPSDTEAANEHLDDKKSIVPVTAQNGKSEYKNNGTPLGKHTTDNYNIYYY